MSTTAPVTDRGQADLAGTAHWNGVYQSLAQDPERLWEPSDYGSIAIARVLLDAVSRAGAKTVLEVGCGNSIWLPYVARKTGVEVAGLDYSETGCELARRQLASNGVSGTIYCRDLFAGDNESIGTYDLVYSLGMVEHFTDTNQVLGKLLDLVRPGGFLLTEVPNLKSVHGLLTWLWQPELMAKHKALSKRNIVDAYRQLSLANIDGRYLGIFSLQIVAWSVYPRWPRLLPRFVPAIARLQQLIDSSLRRLNRYGGIAPFAPYIYVVGRKPFAGDPAEQLGS
jgi:SAM-dependent methyltransferase